MRQIKLTPEEVEQLQKRFGVGKNYIWQVLSFSKHGPTAERIRRAALQMGARYVDPDFAPNCRTEYANGYIIQTFSHDVVLRIEVKTGTVTISHRGNAIEKIDNATMSMWNSMAMKAQDIAETAMVAR